MLTSEEKSIRHQLYSQGLNDREIAEKVGVTPSAITQWRHTNKLPANGGGCGFGNKEKDGLSTPMEYTLAPDQCEDMKRFLSSLLKYADIAQEAGRKLDVGRFMVEYREAYRGQETRQYETI